MELLAAKNVKESGGCLVWLVEVVNMICLRLGKGDWERLKSEQLTAMDIASLAL